jgi:hypothetical protein
VRHGRALSESVGILGMLGGCVGGYLYGDKDGSWERKRHVSMQYESCIQRAPGTQRASNKNSLLERDRI